MRRSTLVGWLVALCCVVVATVGLQVSDRPDDTQDIVGVRDEPIGFGDGTVTVGEVRVGQGVDRFDEVSHTTGLFVVVRISLWARGTSKLSLGTLKLRSGDRTYDPYETAAIGVEPGFEQTSDLSFEVDPQRIDGLTLQMSQPEIVSGYHQELRVQLGITPENAQAWRDASVGQVVLVAADSLRAPR
jgi:hypothetical protein